MTRKRQSTGPPPFLRLLPGSERRSLAEILRAETFGGLVLLAAALIALVWANSPLADSYEHVKEFEFGPSALGLHLSVAHWTADGLLAIFFLVAGIELKRELVRGELSTPTTSTLPSSAARSPASRSSSSFSTSTSGDAGGTCRSDSPHGP